MIKAREIKIKKTQTIRSTVLLFFFVCPLLFPPIYSGVRRLCMLEPTHRPPFCHVNHGKPLAASCSSLLDWRRLVWWLPAWRLDEWLRRWITNPLLVERPSSNLALVDMNSMIIHFRKIFVSHSVRFDLLAGKYLLRFFYLQDWIDFDALTELSSIMDMAYYS